MRTLGCLFVFIFALIFALVAAVWNMMQTLLGGKSSVRDVWRWVKRAKARHSQWTDGEKAEKRGGDASASSSSAPHGTTSDKHKVIPDDVGEYVDFEEVKE